MSTEHPVELASTADPGPTNRRSSGASPAPGDAPTRSDPRRPWIWWVVGGAALLGAVAVGAAALADDGTDGAAAPLVLSLGEGESAASCLPFSEATLAAMPTAFAGTVSAIDRDAITLTVDRWYTGGDAAVIELATVTDAQALLGGFPVEVGSEYLITASDGAVSYCGYSGPSTPELEAAFDAAFAG